MQNFKDNNFMKLILIIILSIVISISISKITAQKHCKNKFSNEIIANYEENKNSNFKIKQILVYSSADGEDKSEGNYLQDINISSYSDIAIYIDNNSKDGLSEENTINELYIDNIKYETAIEKANLKFGYKNPNDFGAMSDIYEVPEEGRINFRVAHSNSEENDYDTPTFFTDCSNPITLGFISSEILQHFRLSQSNKLLSFNGKILKDANIDLRKIEPKISFNIHIVNNVNEEFLSKVFLNLEFENSKDSITDGYIISLDYKSLNGFVKVDK